MVDRAPFRDLDQSRSWQPAKERASVAPRVRPVEPASRTSNVTSSTTTAGDRDGPVRPIPFVKMHGAANDFVVIDHRERFLPRVPDARTELFARLCDRRRGIGADGVLLLERDPEFDFAMRYFNSDGGVADYCGNGARCLASFALGLGMGARASSGFAPPPASRTRARCVDASTCTSAPSSEPGRRSRSRRPAGVSRDV